MILRYILRRILEHLPPCNLVDGLACLQEIKDYREISSCEVRVDAYVVVLVDPRVLENIYDERFCIFVLCPPSYSAIL